MSDLWGINLNLDDFDRLLRKEDLVEEPVSPDIFVHDKRFLGLPQLSELQLEIVKHNTQILKPHTLIQLMGEEKGMEYYEKYTVNEVIAQLGKGSGKDHVSRISMAYVVYLFHCLRDPLDYYNKAGNIHIALINLAVNAKQAQQVFFEPFKNLLLNSPYFNEHPFEPRVQELYFFERPVRCFSGHSESEGWEGYDVMMCVLDEISAFKTDAELQDSIRQRGSASQIYNMAKASVISRFPDVGKVILLSFPRFKDDFIQERYNEYINLKPPKMWGLKAATWEVNPTITYKDLEPEFIRNPIDARARFACEPPEMEDAYFRDADSVRNAFKYGESPINDEGQWKTWFNGRDNYSRFIHVDLGLKRDAAALSMVHISGMKEVKTSAGIEVLPIIYVDLVYRWKADHGSEIDFASVRSLIVELSRKFDIAGVTFDMWQSADMIQSLKIQGINAEWHTVKKADYDTMSTAIYDNRLRGYWDEHLVENELLKLKLITNTKIDHPSSGSKDAADAVAGAVFRCIENAVIGQEIEIEIFRDDDMSIEYDDEILEKIIPIPEGYEPVRESEPEGIRDWLMEML